MFRCFVMFTYCVNRAFYNNNHILSSYVCAVCRAVQVFLGIQIKAQQSQNAQKSR